MTIFDLWFWFSIYLFLNLSIYFEGKFASASLCCGIKVRDVLFLGFVEFIHVLGTWNTAINKWNKNRVGFCEKLSTVDVGGESKYLEVV